MIVQSFTINKGTRPGTANVVVNRRYLVLVDPTRAIRPANLTQITTLCAQHLGRELSDLTNSLKIHGATTL